MPDLDPDLVLFLGLIGPQIIEFVTRGNASKDTKRFVGVLLAIGAMLANQALFDAPPIADIAEFGTLAIGYFTAIVGGHWGTDAVLKVATGRDINSWALPSVGVPDLVRGKSSD